MDKQIDKEMLFTSQIIDLCIVQMTKDAMPAGDFQSCIEAIVKKAIAYGRTLD